MLFKSTSKASLKSFIATQKKKNLLSIAKSISEILEIAYPKIEFVDCIFKSAKGIDIQKTLCFDELPSNAQCFQGYFNGKVSIALKAPVYGTSSKNLIGFKDVTIFEQLFFIAHELRHIWQKQYHADLYYQVNAHGSDVIMDISEIDADAFALLFIFSDLIDFKPLEPDNLSYCFNAFWAYTYLDDGARLERAKELSKQYNWGNWERIEVFDSKISAKNILRNMDNKN